MIFVSPSIINFMIKLSSFDLSKIFIHNNGSIDEKTEFFSEIKAILYYMIILITSILGSMIGINKRKES